MNKTTNKTSLLQNALNQSLIDNGRQPIDWQKVIYAFDNDISDLESIIKLKKSNIIHQDEIEDILFELFKDGPDWICTLIISSCPDFVLITLDVGEKIGNPKPSITVSYETNKTVEITE